MATTGIAVGATGIVGARASGRAGRRGQPAIGPIPERGEQQPPHTVTIRSRSDRVEYRLAVSGAIEFGPEAGENDEIEDGARVSGVIDGRGVDDYRFSGRITDFDLLVGEAEITVDGEAVDDPVGRPERDARRCVEIEPLRFRNQTVTEFYGYTPDLSDPNPRQSNTPTNLEEVGVSRLFLFEGLDGLSLVVVHGGDGDDGGAASFEFTGLPPDGEWVVLDDSHEGSDDVFEIGETSASMHWAWGVAGRNDGAAFRGLGDDFRVRIDPAFGDAARRDPLGPGRATAFQVLSGSARDPNVVSVPMDEPLVIATVEREGACPPVDDGDDVDGRIVDLSVDDATFEPGDEVSTTVTAENTGSRAHTFVVGYSVFGPDGKGRHNDGTTDEPLTLEAGETGAKTVTWTVERDAPSGVYDAHVILWSDRKDGTLEGNLDDEWRRSAFVVRGEE